MLSTSRLILWLVIGSLAVLVLVGCRSDNSEQPIANRQQPTVNSEQSTENNQQSKDSREQATGTAVLATVAGELIAAETATVTPYRLPSPTPVPSLTPTPTPAFPLYEGPALRREDMGVQVHIHREDMGEIMAHLRELGVGWVKVQVSWKLYQSAPEQYTEDRFAELDDLVQAARANDIDVLLGVSKAPEWSRLTTELDGPPIDYDLYQQFMAFLAGRYRGRVAAYELWNEPNLQREWNGSPLSAADFVRLIEAGAAGVRSADPEALLISGAPATTGINDGVTAVDDRVFLRGMLEAGVGNIVDAVGAHPYGWANPPDSNVTSPDSAVPSHNNHPSFFFAETLADYVALLDEFGINKMLWVTEFGWGTFEGITNDDGEPASPPAGAEFMAYIGEWQQAEYILRAYELALGWEHVGPMVLWNLNFGPLLGDEFSESGYSLLRPDGLERPSYLALQAASKQ